MANISPASFTFLKIRRTLPRVHREVRLRQGHHVCEWPRIQLNESGKSRSRSRSGWYASSRWRRQSTVLTKGRYSAGQTPDRALRRPEQPTVHSQNGYPCAYRGWSPYATVLMVQKVRRYLCFFRKTSRTRNVRRKPPALIRPPANVDEHFTP